MLSMPAALRSTLVANRRWIAATTESNMMRRSFGHSTNARRIISDVYGPLIERFDDKRISL
jgi:hypothetical protein